MAHNDFQQTFKQLLDNLGKIETPKIYRESLGTLSKREKLEPIYLGILQKIEIINQTLNDISDGTLQNFNGLLTNIVNVLSSLSSFDDTAYATQADSYTDQLKVLSEQMDGTLTLSTSIVLMKSGVLRPELVDKGASDFLKGYEETIKIKISEFEKDANEKIKDLLKSANDSITTKTEQATRTTQGVSLKEVQTQLTSVNEKLRNNLIGWGLASLIAIGSFFGFTYKFSNHTVNASQQTAVTINDKTENPSPGHSQDTPTYTLTETVYSIAIRITVLSALGAIAAYLMNIFKSNLHMYYKNTHRIAIANSAEAFIASGQSPESRDAAFFYLVQNLSEFGDSGLLDSKQENIHASKLMIDIAKNAYHKAD